MKKCIKEWIKNKESKSIILELIKWLIIDIYRKIKYGVKPHLYGVRCVTGMYGCGKTMVLTKLAYEYRKKYNDKIYIATNYGFKLQDFRYESLEQLVKQYDKPIVFLWDEVQNDFPSNEKEFPAELRRALTLNRKGNGKMFFWSSQDHELVHKTIRRLTIQYGLARTLFNRYTRVRWYLKEDYQRLFEENNFEKKMKIKPFKTDKFVQTDKLRSLYDSFGWDNGENIKKSCDVAKNKQVKVKTISKKSCDVAKK